MSVNLSSAKAQRLRPRIIALHLTGKHSQRDLAQIFDCSRHLVAAVIAEHDAAHAAEHRLDAVEEQLDADYAAAAAAQAVGPGGVSAPPGLAVSRWDGIPSSRIPHQWRYGADHGPRRPVAHNALIAWNPDAGVRTGSSGHPHNPDCHWTPNDYSHRPADDPTLDPAEFPELHNRFMIWCEPCMTQHGAITRGLPPHPKDVDANGVPYRGPFAGYMGPPRGADYRAYWTQAYTEDWAEAHRLQAEHNETHPAPTTTRPEDK